MSNGQQKAKETVEAFLAWKTTISETELAAMEWRGEIKKIEVAKAIGCGTSAFRQNPALKNEYDQFMDELRQKGILPRVTAEAKVSTGNSKEYDHTSRLRQFTAQKANKLEQENIELKARITDLERKLERYTELSEAMSDLGIVPL